MVSRRVATALALLVLGLALSVAAPADAAHAHLFAGELTPTGSFICTTEAGWRSGTVGATSNVAEAGVVTAFAVTPASVVYDMTSIGSTIDPIHFANASFRAGPGTTQAGSPGVGSSG